MSDGKRTLWSEHIQGILNLDLSREMRFQDSYSRYILDTLRLKSDTIIADIGCGPGTISRKIAKWLGSDTRVLGIDRDINFLQYAKDKAKSELITNVDYIEGNALNLPLNNSSVDACISHTVIEHVPNREFLLEQKRICRNNGIVSIIYCRPDKYINSSPDLLPKVLPREKELMDKLFSIETDVDRKNGVGQYLPKEHELPALFEELGFKEIRVDALALPVAIDNFRFDEEKLIMIDYQKSQMLEIVERGYKVMESITQDEYQELIRLIDDRFDVRMKLAQQNKKIWDYTIVIEQVVSGKVVK